MSIQAMSHVWETSKQSEGTLLCLLAIADYANENWIAWPSVQTLAKKSRMSERNVQFALRRLEQSGEIKTFKKQGPNGTNLYQVLRVDGENISSGEGETKMSQISPCPDEAHFTRGVKPISPKPSIEPSRENRKEPKRTADNPPKHSQPRIVFSKPTIDVIREFMRAIDYHAGDPERFYDYYEANGWRVGKNPMKDWKSTVRNWKRNDQEKSTAAVSKQPDWLIPPRNAA